MIDSKSTIISLTFLISVVKKKLKYFDVISHIIEMVALGSLFRSYGFPCMSIFLSHKLHID